MSGWHGDCSFVPHGETVLSARSGSDTQCILEACLIALRIRHRTTYTYCRLVTLGPHRLMLRPRESRDLRLISGEINVTPEGALTSAQDVFGNAVATVTFSAMTDVLTIDAAAELELHATPWPVFDIAALRRSHILFDIRTTNGPIWAQRPSNNMPIRTGVCGDGREILLAATGQIHSLCSRI